MPGQSPAPLSLDAMVSRAPGVLAAEVDGEVAMLSVEKGTFYGLNRVGSRIWGLVATPVVVGDVCTQLLSEFEIERVDCERDVLALLEDLRAEGLIAVEASS